MSKPKNIMTIEFNLKKKKQIGGILHIPNTIIKINNLLYYLKKLYDCSKLNHSGSK